MSTQNTYMKQALQAAKNAAARREVPVGAVVVHAGEIIAVKGNEIIERHDPTAHAEMLALQEAAAVLGNERLIECDLYVTLEPCAMCAGAISLSRVDNVFIGALDPKGGAVLHGPKFFEQSTCHHRPNINQGLYAEESRQLLVSFFKMLRKKSP